MRERFVGLRLIEAISDEPDVAEKIGRIKGIVVEAKSQKEAADIVERFFEGRVTDIER